MQDKTIAVLIPSYDRPDLLKNAVQIWLSIGCVKNVLIVAEASSRRKFDEYDSLLSNYSNNPRVCYKLTMNRLGSVKARNLLLDLARKSNCSHAVMVDDDYIPTAETALETMASELDKNASGLIGGKVIIAKKRKDPDFFLNLPLSLADSITRLVGYVFLDTVHGPRFCEFMPHFFMINKNILDLKLSYDSIYETPTAFREESDFQSEVKSKGFSLLFDPRISILHLAAETGGDRPKMSEGKRIYWKARNHQIFILKWNSSSLKLFWYTFTGLLLLSGYRIWYLKDVLRGIKDGIHYSKLVVGI